MRTASHRERKKNISRRKSDLLFKRIWSSLLLGNFFVATCCLQYELEQWTKTLHYWRLPQIIRTVREQLEEYKDNSLISDKIKKFAKNCSISDKIKNLRTALHRKRKKYQSKKNGSSLQKSLRLSYLLACCLQHELEQ